MTTYFTSDYRDSFTAMRQALESRGFTRVSKYKQADLIFLDREPTGNDRKWNIFSELAKRRPVFIYPHTPYSSWLWDGYTKPIPDVACNFVANEAAVLIMQSYGYPCRVKNVGFTLPLKVKPFQATAGRHLAYAGPRLLGVEGRWYREGDKIKHFETMDWIVANREHFEEITIFYSFDLDTFQLRGYEKYNFNFVCVARDSVESKFDMNTANAVRQLQDVELFFGSNTMGYISMSQGIPTVLVGHNNDTPLISTNNGEHYADYAQYCDFPLRLADMTATEVKSLCFAPSPQVESWKKLNIGTNFDADKFIKIIKEYI